MPLTAGAKLGPYEILSRAGAGGMGEVYKARDTRLNRTVAIKVLPSDLTDDPAARQRLEREARAIAALSHTNVCPLFDIGHQDGTDYLVMEFLEGETLAHRLTRGKLPLDQALEYGIQIADALAAAHRADIIHRDLKPGNIMLTKSGAKLLDFGLAKPGPSAALPAGFSMVPTGQHNLTERGTIVGTFQYMAPEQLEGEEADVRTDIFSFGAVLYEMVTGKPAFAGKTHSSLISAILRDQPQPVSDLEPLAAPQLDHVLARCLAKSPEARWQDARDLSTELSWVRDRSLLGLPSGREERRTASRRVKTGLIVAACVLAGIAAGGLAARIWTREPGSAPLVTRTLVSTAPAERLQALPMDRAVGEGRPSRTTIIWSPDGRSIVFSGAEGDRQQLYVRSLDRLTAAALPSTEGASDPFFSPDGRWIGFWSGGALKKIALGEGGGAATTICNAPKLFGASWGADGTITYSIGEQGLWQVAASGGTPKLLARPDSHKGELKYMLPQNLPGTPAILFTVTHTPFPTWDDTDVVLQVLTTGDRKILVHGGADGRYAPTGHVLYVRQGTLMAVPFDLRHLEVTGGGVALIAGVMQSAHTLNEMSESGAAQFSVSAAGSLLYVPGGMFPSPERSLVWVDRKGSTQTLALPLRPYMSPRVSPDGHRIVLWTQGDRNIWVLDLLRGVLTRLTSEGRNARAIWTPDGTRITYGSATAGPENLYWRAADGSGSAERLTTSESQDTVASWTPDGRTLLFMELNQTTGYDLWTLSANDRRRRPLLQTPFNEQYADFSPDGRWMAYTSNESGRSEVYVQPYPGPGPRQQVSTDGGTAPAWSRTGGELYYMTSESLGGQAAPARMMVVSVRTRPTFQAGAPKVLFEGKYGAAANVRDYDVTADGRFLMIQQKERAPATPDAMIFVQNWVEELKREVPP
jgi:serine/threonine-protein kinase